MSKVDKDEIIEFVNILQDIDRTSFLIIKSGAEMLKARQMLDESKAS